MVGLEDLLGNSEDSVRQIAEKKGLTEEERQREYKDLLRVQLDILVETLANTRNGIKGFGRKGKQKLAKVITDYETSRYECSRAEDGTFKKNTYGRGNLERPFAFHALGVAFLLLDYGADYFTVLAGYKHDNLETMMEEPERAFTESNLSDEHKLGALSLREKAEIEQLRGDVFKLTKKHLAYLHKEPQKKVLQQVDTIVQVVARCTRIIDNYLKYAESITFPEEGEEVPVEVKERAALVKIADGHYNLMNTIGLTIDEQITALVKAVSVANAVAKYAYESGERPMTKEMRLILGTRAKTGALYRMIDQAYEVAQRVKTSLEEELRTTGRIMTSTQRQLEEDTPSLKLEKGLWDRYKTYLGGAVEPKTKPETTRIRKYIDAAIILNELEKFRSIPGYYNRVIFTKNGQETKT